MGFVTAVGYDTDGVCMVYVRGWSIIRLVTRELASLRGRKVGVP